jgi:hypothetical protein
MNQRLILIPALIVLLIQVACVERVERPQKIDFNRYFPMAVENEYFYSTQAHKVTINNILDNSLYTFTYSDSSGNSLWWVDYFKSESGVKWKNIVVNSTKIPAIFFEPPLPFSPWSNTVGDTLLYSGIEIRADSVNTHVPIMVEYEVMAIEDINTPAGLFADCIKMLDGESFYWFALDVGLIKYVSAGISSELVRATTYDRQYPNEKGINP